MLSALSVIYKFNVLLGFIVRVRLLFSLIFENENLAGLHMSNELEMA